jgi:formylglycine-generating enzyme required for sulfatase activity
MGNHLLFFVIIILLSSFNLFAQDKSWSSEISTNEVTSSSKKREISNEIGIEFVQIPEGNFQMGCSLNDLECYGDEKPNLNVSIQAFYLSKFEITQGIWKKVMGENPSYFINCGDNCPVEKVSWFDVQEFVKRLCTLEKIDQIKCPYRLPTEAEWEYSARGNTKTTLYTGPLNSIGESNSKELDIISFYGGNSGVSYQGGDECSSWSGKQYSSNFCGTNQVGKKKPNSYGLYDMLGNVSEWCHDWYDSDRYTKSNIFDLSQGKGDYHVIRGGAWDSYTRNLRVSARNFNISSFRSRNLGFRLVYSPKK